MNTCLPFLRVPDIAAAIAWYEGIGFTCLGTHQEPGCDLDWALLELKGAQFMLYPEGRPDTGQQKDGGLYFSMECITGFVERIRATARILEENPRTEYGKREIVFLDLNGFQVTFGCDPGPE